MNACAADKQIYYNCLILAPDGAQLGFCDRKREAFYLKNGLATSESVKHQRVIRLKFEPKARNGSDSIILEPRKNICVICGSSDELTKHHIVPTCYRIHMPRRIKSHNSHDVVAICRKHHDQYETESALLRRELAKDFSVLEPFVRSEAVLKLKCVHSAARTIVKHGGKIPVQKLSIIRKVITKHFGWEPTEAEIIAIASTPYPKVPKEDKHGYMIVNKLKSDDKIH